MSRIRVLPEILSNQIAAGEVVERPASVVKELLENALDAGADRILIEAEDGGKSLIRVSDNGCGMGRDDALLSIERYATSKIYREGDLFAIRTLGFRGEALPSIASVSRFSMVTREASALSGTSIEIAGGKLLTVSEAGAPPGTMISVRQIFFNTPARRKFLKSTATEIGHIADTVAAVSIGWPKVHFKIVHNRKTIKILPDVSDPAERIPSVVGDDIRRHLRRIDLENRSVSLSGWVCAPEVNRSTARGIYLFVNGRAVRDRMILDALFRGFAGRLMKGSYPVAALFLNVPFTQVDVNVHPTKHEVRFAEPEAIHDAVRKGVVDALAAARPLPVSSPPGPFVAEAKPVYSASQDLPTEAAPEEKFRQDRLWTERRFASLRFIGPFRDTYILCESDEGLFLIDQHAAHERFVFERLRAQAASGTPEAQRLIAPEAIELGFGEAEALNRLLPEMERLGFEIEPFGGNSFVIKSVPALLEGREVGPLVREIAERSAEIGFARGIEKVVEECLILIACHRSVRANRTLSGIEIQTLLEQLDACADPEHCPHGRPTFIRWPTRSIEKSFGRTV